MPRLPSIEKPTGIEWITVAVGRFLDAVAVIEHARIVAVADLAAVEAISALTRREAPKPPEMLTTRFADLLAGHLLGGVDRGEDRVARRLDIDDHAVAHAARDLMADADDARLVCLELAR